VWLVRRLLREAVISDSALQELAQTPLMLSIMSLACQGAGGDELAHRKEDSLEGRREQIFGLYVEQTFRHGRAISVAFPKEKAIGWLSWLAQKMREHAESVFFVESLQPNWLGTGEPWAAYGTVRALGIGLTVGLTIGLIAGMLSGGFAQAEEETILGLKAGMAEVILFWLAAGIAFGLVVMRWVLIVDTGDSSYKPITLVRPRLQGKKAKDLAEKNCLLAQKFKRISGRLGWLCMKGFPERWIITVYPGKNFPHSHLRRQDKGATTLPGFRRPFHRSFLVGCV
jgi:hypothetical protein